MPSSVTQGTCHSCLHLVQSILDMFGIDVPQGQRSVPLCVSFLFVISVTLMSGSASGSLTGAGGSLAGGVSFSMVSEVLFRLSGL